MWGHTYSTTIRSTDDDIVLELEVGREEGGVEVRLAVEAVADAPPVGCGFGHAIVGPSWLWVWDMRSSLSRMVYTKTGRLEARSLGGQSAGWMKFTLPTTLSLPLLSRQQAS